MIEQEQGLNARDQARLLAAAEALRSMNADLVEWTVMPIRDWGLQLSAEVTLTDGEDPLRQLSGLLQQIEGEVARLDVKLPR